MPGGGCKRHGSSQRGEELALFFKDRNEEDDGDGKDDGEDVLCFHEGLRYAPRSAEGGDPPPEVEALSNNWI